MATYKGIQGYSVQKLSSDPTASEAEGQLWYNSGTGKFKIAEAGAGAWSSGGAINTARRYMSGVGSTTAGLIFNGGPDPSPPSDMKLRVESYNGTAWTEVNNTSNELMTRGRAGTQTAALASGAPTSQVVESYDGTSWTEVNILNAIKGATGSMGIQTAAIVAGGDRVPSPATVNESETYDGTCWAEGNNINNGRNALAGCGTTTAALIFGGTPPVPVLGVHTESYDGTCWSETNNLNVGRYGIGGSGLQTAALAIAGGTPTQVTSTEKWDGTSWTEVGDLATAVRWAGTSTVTGTDSAYIAGGLTAAPASTDITEIWADPVYAIKTVTVS
jgi:hypothetical protein